jgi:hypothetical protein
MQAYTISSNVIIVNVSKLRNNAIIVSLTSIWIIRLLSLFAANIEI